MNSSLLIRSFAIFAELSFAGLIAKSLLRLNHDVPEIVEKENKFVAFLQTKTPIIFFACIFIANIFATSATITKIDLLFAIEGTFCGASGLYAHSHADHQPAKVVGISKHTHVGQIENSQDRDDHHYHI